MQSSRRDTYLTPANIGVVVSDWMNELGDLRGRRRPFVPGRTGLIVIDPQALFTESLSPGYLPAWKAVEPNVFRLVELFIERGLPVLFTRHIDVPGTGLVKQHFFPRPIVDADPLSRLAVKFQKYLPLVEVIEKTTFHVSLDMLPIGFAGCDTIVLAGVQAHLCVLATALAVAAGGVIPVVVADGIAAPDQASHQAALRVLGSGHASIVSTCEVVAALDSFTQVPP
jgi:isochorismate hydrolase